MGMLDKVKPGEWVHIKVTHTPTRPAAVDTLQRLMRMNPPIQRALDHARRDRVRDPEFHRQRAGRPWKNRPRAGKVVRPEAGQEFYLRNRPQIWPDLESLSDCLEVEKAPATPPW